MHLVLNKRSFNYIIINHYNIIRICRIESLVAHEENIKNNSMIIDML